MMDRRAFISTLAGAIFGSWAVDPERLLWTPGAKLISIPSPSLLAQTISAQTEFVRPELEELMLFSSVLWKRIQAKENIAPISRRVARVPFLVYDAN